jgi:hypothetical protein
VDVPYEASLQAELTLNTDECDLWTQVQEVLYLARKLSRMAAFRDLHAQRRLECR